VDREAGLSRRRHGRGFRYLDAAGRPVRDVSTLARIRALAIPPAWTSVWICADGRGHIQATGRDARGRKQYRYHAEWTRRRDEAKFDRLLAVGEALPRLRRLAATALARPGLDRERVLAAVASLLDSSFARVGNREYRRTNGSFGLTTLENRHVRRGGGALRLAFRGKAGVAHEIQVDDARLARTVRRCQDLPGQRLFQYVDDAGEPRPIDSDDVNAWLREASGVEITAKDLRTWHGTSLALDFLLGLRGAGESAKARPARAAVAAHVAARLVNTPAVCLRHYVHPDLFADDAGDGFAALSSAPRVRGLAAREARLLAWLRSRNPPAAARLRAS
jgi:DNA topoisomerase-1